MDAISNNTVAGSGLDAQDAIKLVTDDTVQAIKEIAALKAAHDAGGIAAVAKLLPALLPEVEKDVSDVRTAVPFVEAGWKTSELWLIVGTGLAQIGYFAYFKTALPLPVTIAINTLAGVYAVNRSISKTAVLKSPKQS